ncbi:unnamed protein product [Pneumocystis jirovecii]|uniref:CRAL-TRIO domain-containing protein n=2 Tax=Pneumocystis jirovecii TaxID=42068 RepID=L0PBQ3_PNEJI|nr:uncharacterized protein T551_03469 [Pneumocystis jirovecii RU7]KTW26552.1 hypothetical protein T551_03469 [Pneumocystis jirovecii RU7]CCJ29793.1 unnamed protein product [Pneumocystis jirovecii]
MGNLTRKQEIALKCVWAALLHCRAVKCQDEEKSDVQEENLDEKIHEKLEIEGKNQNNNYKNGADVKEINNSLKCNGDDNFNDNERYGWTKAFGEMLRKEGKELLAVFWEMIKMDNPDRLMQRFLRARRWNQEKTVVMLIETLQWRREFNVEGILRHGDGDKEEPDAVMFLKQMKLGKSFIRGVDRENRPICYIRTHLHRATDQPDTTLQRYIVWLMENARFMISFPVETATIFFDLTKFSLKNIDYAPVKFLIKCFEAHYPESMGICIVHKAPWVFQGIWKIIKGWLDPVVVKKIHFTNSCKELEAYIDISQLIKDVGGKDDWKYVYVEPVEGENDKMKDTETRDKLIQERTLLIQMFETLTTKWILEKNEKISDQLLHERNLLAKDLSHNYWKLDPYIRARSLYDRIGAISAETK